MFSLTMGKCDFTDDMMALFLSDEITTAQRSVCCMIFQGIYQDFIHFLCDKISKQHEHEPLLNVSVADMMPECQAKLRYIDNGRRYVRSNLTSTNQNTYEKVEREYLKVELIEENLTIPFDILKVNTCFPKTLEIT